MNRPLVELLATSGTAAARELRARAARRAALAAWVRSAKWLLVVPAAVLALHVAQVLLGLELVALGLPSILALTFVPAFGFALATWFAATRALAEARVGLARLDRELSAEGRLQAAHEFLGAPAPTPFMAAAIADSASHAERALAHQLAADQHASRSALAWQVPLLATTIAVVAAWLGPGQAPRLGRGDTAEQTATAVPAAPPRRAPQDSSAPVPPPTVPARTSEAKPRTEHGETGREERTAAAEPDRQPRESVGKTGEGRAASAQPTNSSSDSRGFQSSQAPPTERGDPGKPSTKKPKPPKGKDEPATPKKKLDQSGATAGKGTGAGSSRNPGSTDWQSKDQVTTDEEQPLNEDQDVEDDQDESEARGGLQPSLRDRRPAVNRDLQIGFGNGEPPPDANGRGGPSEHKKSRGVASLVLGVPIPDHVKGEPNPGRIKITQERVEPRADDAEPIEASARAQREAPIGSLGRRELAPWMREVVRAYFQRLRTSTEKTQ